MHINVTTNGLLFFPEYSLDLSGLKLFIGECGTGKTAIVSALSLIHAIAQRSLSDWTHAHGSVSDLFHQGEVFTEEIVLKIERDHEKYHCILQKNPENPESLILKRELLVIREAGEQNQFETIEVRTGDAESIFGVSFEASAEPAYEIMTAISGWWVGHVSSQAIRNPESNDAGRHLYPTGRNLIPYIISLRERDPAAFARLQSVIASVCPDFSGFVVVQKETGPRLMYETPKRPVLIPFTHFPDSLLRFICYAALFVSPNLPECIIIDDLDSGMDEIQIRTLLMLASTTAKRTNLLITTRCLSLATAVAGATLL